MLTLLASTKMYKTMFSIHIQIIIMSVDEVN